MVFSRGQPFKLYLILRQAPHIRWVGVQRGLLLPLASRGLQSDRKMVTLKERLILLLRIESVSPVFGPTNYPTQPDCANQPQKRCVGVAVATETVSRLFAVVLLDNGFPLMLGAAGSDFRLYKRQNPCYIPLISGCAKTTGGWRNQSY